MELNNYLVFLATALILVASPGPDTILILSRTLASGRGAGWWTLLGTQVGNLTHAVLAGVGVSTIILLFPLAFALLKWVGAGYLIYLAVAAWRASPKLRLGGAKLGARPTPFRSFRQGLANNLVNPKMIPFFLALFPQFVRPQEGSLLVQSLILGSTLAAMALVWIGGLVLLVNRFRAAFAANETFVRIVHRVTALTFAGLAVRLIASER